MTQRSFVRMALATVFAGGLCAIAGQRQDESPPSVGIASGSVSMTEVFDLEAVKEGDATITGEIVRKTDLVTGARTFRVELRLQDEPGSRPWSLSFDAEALRGLADGLAFIRSRRSELVEKATRPTDLTYRGKGVTVRVAFADGRVEEGIESRRRPRRRVPSPSGSRVSLDHLERGVKQALGRVTELQ